MSGYDIGNEIRINWDKSVSPWFPFFACSAAYDREAILAAITATITAKRAAVEDMEAWLSAYLTMPVDRRRDWIPQPATKQKRAYRKKVKP